MGRSRIFFQAFLIPIAGADGIECPSGKRIGIHVSNYRDAPDDQIPEKPVCRTRQDRARSKRIAIYMSPRMNPCGTCAATWE
jgi:hypothetical protein